MRRIGLTSLMALTSLLLTLVLAGCGEQEKTGPTRSGSGLLVLPFEGQTTKMPRRPMGVATGGGAVWVTSMAGGVLTKADPKTGEAIGKPIKLNEAPYSVLYAYDKVWVTTFQRDRLYQVNPETKKVIRFTKLEDRPFGMAAGFDSLWITSIRDETLSRVDPKTGRRIGEPIRLSGTPFKVTTGFGYVWVTNVRDGKVDRIDPKTNKVVGSTRVGGPTCTEASIAKNKKYDGAPRNEMVTNCGSPAAITAAGKYIWVTNIHGDPVKKGQAKTTKVKQGIPNGEVWRLDPKTGEVIGEAIPVPIRPISIVGDDESVWVLSLDAGALTRIDTKTAVRDKTPIDVSGGPTDLALGFDKLWITMSTNDKLASMSTAVTP
jgi:DNA-binding beta-propeller fold protein YncE